MFLSNPIGLVLYTNETRGAWILFIPIGFITKHLIRHTLNQLYNNIITLTM